MDKQGLFISPAPPPPKTELRKRKRKKKNRTASRKICVICNGLPYTDDGSDEQDRFHVYVLNLNSDLETSAEPILRFRYSGHYFTTCVVNSTLYFIEGVSGVRREARNFAFFYKLPSSPPTTPIPVLDYTTLENKTAPMNGIKCNPMGIPTPDYKAILVFSMCIFLSLNEYVNFELYNVAADKWDVLPELFPCLINTATHGLRSDWAKIESYAFVDESTFLIQTEGRRIFTLNLKSPECWKSVDYDMFSGMGRRRFAGHFFGVGNGLVMDFCQIYDMNAKKTIKIPRAEGVIFKPFDDRHNWYRAFGSMTLLPLTSANESTFCVLHPLPLDVPPGVFLRPRFCISVQHFDPATCFSDKSTGKFKPNKMKSFKFVLAKYGSMRVSGFFPMEEHLLT